MACDRNAVFNTQHTLGDMCGATVWSAMGGPQNESAKDELGTEGEGAEGTGAEETRVCRPLLASSSRCCWARF